MSKLRVELRLMYNLYSDTTEKRIIKEAIHALQSNFLNSPRGLEYIDADFDTENKHLQIEFNAYTYNTEDFEPIVLPQIYNEFIRYKFVQACKEYQQNYPNAAQEVEIQLYDLPGDEFNVETFLDVPSSCRVAKFIVDSCKYDPALKQKLKRAGLDVDSLLLAD